MPPKIPEPSARIDGEELLARAIFVSKYITADGVMPGAFMPQEQSMESSVMRIAGLPEQAKWRLLRFVRLLAFLRRRDKSKSPRPIFGRADIAVADVRAPLRTEPETTDHPRHAVIIGWPQSRDERAVLAAELAQIATPVGAPAAWL